jgi:hypothetical protein
MAGCSLGTSEFDAQISSIKFWKGDENLRPIYKKLIILEDQEA